jgi:signal recognition particle subunit SRP68
MSMKSAHTADTNGIAGRTRSHIVSRLDRAARTAENLAEILADTSASGASSTDVLEARAYAGLLRGSANFEKQDWRACIQSYSVPFIIYNAFSSASKGDTYKDLLETIDTSISHAAYKLSGKRNEAALDIARKTFPHSESDLVNAVNKIDPTILKQGGDAEVEKGPVGAENAPKTLTWRSREVRIEDAAIAIAWGAVQTAKAGLAEKIAAAGVEPKEVAGAYDEILMACQDAVDATKQAMDELKAEGVDEGKPRMQSLQVTRTAVNFEMVSWRVGRNRVLTGEHDGAYEEVPETAAARKRGGKEREEQEEPPRKKQKSKEETPSRRIARLKEKVALYDATLQSLEAVKVLPGIPADEKLSSALDATVKYFNALKYVPISLPILLSSFGIAPNPGHQVPGDRALALHRRQGRQRPRPHPIRPRRVPPSLHHPHGLVLLVRRATPPQHPGHVLGRHLPRQAPQRRAPAPPRPCPHRQPYSGGRCRRRT